METDQEMFSREALAGYERGVVEKGVVTLVGCGAAGNNVAQGLALAGVGEVRCIDFDTLEPSNYTRSPLFARPQAGAKPKGKAREVAHAIFTLSYARAPTVRYAAASIESLGTGALAGSNVVIAAVDRFEVRAYLADVCRLLGVPLVECGFRAPAGQVAVFPNLAADEPCWRCAHPDATPGGFSCALYAQEIAATGRIAATQSIAAAIGGIVTEAAIQSLHRNFPLGGRALRLDVRSGFASTIELTVEETCPGTHRIAHDIIDLPSRADEPFARVFEALAAQAIVDVALKLPSPFIMGAPCAACGASVSIHQPAFAVREPPRCATCPEGQTATQGELHSVTLVRPGDPIAGTRARKLGLAPGAVVEILDEKDGRTRFARLAGGADELFVTKRRGG